MIKWRNRREFWVKGARLVDPEAGKVRSGCVRVDRGKIAEIAWKKDVKTDLPSLDLEGLILTPGFIDIHSHLREPGNEEKETIETGTAAAAAGGYTSVVCMANTDPVIDDPSVVRYILDRNEEVGSCRLYVAGAVTANLEGEQINEFNLLKTAGAVALSDDGNFVKNSKVMRSALEYAGMLGLTVISHCEDPYLTEFGLMNEGYYSTKLGLAAVPAESEEIAAQRDVALCRLTGSRLHIAHVSTAEVVRMVKRAKKAGIPVTAEVTPHHLTMDDSMLQDYDSNLKVRPPLRSTDDIKELLDGLKSGVIDCVATDHAPHNQIDKQVEFDLAPPGMIGLQTAFSHLYTELVEPGRLELAALVKALTAGPARALGLPGGVLSEGAPADLVIIDPDEEWVFDKNGNRSKSSNSPLMGRKLKSRVQGIFISGKWKKMV